jgi:hypothetical protein
MKDDGAIELLGVIAALLLAFLIAGSDDVTRGWLTLGLLGAAWLGIVWGLCWMVIQAKRGIVKLWAELLDGSAREIS